MNFGEAMIEVFNHKAVYRAGWNGKDMYVAIARGSLLGDSWITKDIIIIRMPPGIMDAWTPSQRDMLEDDWELYTS